MSTAPCLLIPRFHSELISPNFQACGWMSCRPWKGQSSNTQAGLCGLPLTAKQEEQCLREWQNLDADLLQQELFRAANERVLHNNGMSAQEVSALEAFVGTVSHDAGERRVLAQRLLLMAWVQEERILTLRSLSERYTQNAQRLSALLADPDDELSAPAPTYVDPEEARLLPPWRFVLRELKYFLPPEAILGVADIAMAQDLEEMGEIRELTTDERARLPEASQRQQFRGALLSLSTLVGGTSNSPTKGDASDTYLFVLP